MNGNELADAVRSVAPETPIVLISGEGGLEVDTTRFSAFLRKPFTIVELVATVEDLLTLEIATAIKEPESKTVLS